MSWSSAPIEPSDIGHIYTAIDEAQLQSGANPATVEHEAQFAAAKQAARQLIFLNACGPADDGRVFIVSMNGHANPDYQPVPGWANEMVNVSVRSEPADSAAVRYAREAYERYQAQRAEEAAKA